MSYMSLKIFYNASFIYFLLFKSVCTLSNLLVNPQYDLRPSEFIEPIKRIPKLITFKTIDEDLKVDLEYTVPFIKFPIKRSDTTDNTLININLASIVLTGMVVAAGLGISAFFSLFTQTNLTGFKKEKKSDDANGFLDNLMFGYTAPNGTKGEISIWNILEEIEHSFQHYNVDLGSCFQKYVCNLVQKSTENVYMGTGSSFDKIIDGISSSNWLSKKISGTAIKEAIDAGKNDLRCVSKYKQCQYSDNEIQELINFI